MTCIALCIAFHLGWAQQWDTLPTLTNPGNNVAVFNEYQGQLVVAGIFTQAGGITANSVASWDGSSWAAFGGGVTNSMDVRDLEVNGSELIIGGNFDEVDGLAFTEKIAKWNGSNWQSISSQLPNGAVNATFYNGSLYVGGMFGPISGSMSGNCIARWDGLDWQDVGGGIAGGVIWIDDMVEYKGDLYICGRFDFAGGIPMNNIARWDGTQWYSVGNADLAVSTLYVDTINDLLYAGGGFTVIGGVAASKIAVYDGFTWKDVGGGVDFSVYEEGIAIYHQKLYVGGTMSMAGGTVPVNYIACYDGTQWTDVGGGCNAGVSALYTWNDTLWVGGYFDTVGGGTLPALYLAKWYDPTYGTLGLSEVENDRIPLKIYPNPSDGSFTIEVQGLGISNEGLVQIIDMNGRLVDEKTLKQVQGDTVGVVINSSNWSRGNYQCNLIVGGRVVGSETVVIE